MQTVTSTRKEQVMMLKGTVLTSLAGVGAAAAMWLPASAGASTCTVECGGQVPGAAGLTTATASIPSDSAPVAASVIQDRLAGNHNETVLTLV
jgi:hypothetical protein